MDIYTETKVLLSDTKTAYNKENISRQRYYENIYLIDASQGYIVVSSRANGKSLCVGDSFWNIIDMNTQYELNNYLRSFDKKALIINTELGVAFIYNGIYPTSLIFLAVFPNQSPELSLALARQNDELYQLSDSLIEKTQGLLPQNTAINFCAQAAEWKIRQNLVGEIFSLSSYLENISQGILYKMEEQAKLISSLCGCPIDITINNAQNLAEPSIRPNAIQTDFSLYTSFLMISLLLSRKLSKSRSAELIIDYKEESPLVTVVFEPLEELKKKPAKELSVLRNLSERLNIVFYRLLVSGKARITFSPSRKDWSLYGIKTEFEINFDGYCDESPAFFEPQA